MRVCKSTLNYKQLGNTALDIKTEHACNFEAKGHSKELTATSVGEVVLNKKRRKLTTTINVTPATRHPRVLVHQPSFIGHPARAGHAYRPLQPTVRRRI